MTRKITIYEKLFKRPIDVFLSLIALIVFSPFLLIIALLVRLKLGSPILFRQERPGKNEKVFMMYKFRTMNNKKDSNGNLLEDNLRLTKFGKFLRKTSIDELPGLINVFKGNISVIGPRPLLVKYLPLYNEEQRKRHLVRPGLSGLAQVNGRNAISWQEKFKLDVKYVSKITFFGDVSIIFKSIFKVFKREGINSSINTTAEEFKGND